MNVGEVAASSTGDLDLLSRPFILLQKQDALALISCREGAEHSGGTSTDHDGIVMFRDGGLGIHWNYVVELGL